jgi:tetratricopeptide (TPR) repeat protein
MLGVSERQLRSWERQGLIAASGTFGFHDLIALRTLQKLRENRVPPRNIGQAIVSLRKKLAGVEHPLSELRILSNGRRVAVQIAGQKMEAITGQLLFDFEASELNKLRSLPGRAAAAQSRERQAEYWFERGLELEESEAPAREAIEAYKKALEYNPHAAGALVNVGTIYYRLHDYAEAEKYYLKAIETDPRYPLARFNLANLFDERGDLEHAESYYRSALELNPHYADAHFNLALLCEKKGELLAAVQHWKTYLKYDPASSWSEIARRQLERLREATIIRRRQYETGK